MLIYIKILHKGEETMKDFAGKICFITGGASGADWDRPRFSAVPE
jgi:hypothetical protein